MAELNGEPAAELGGPLVNQAVVTLLAKALMEAKRGQWQRVALILAPQEGNVAVACVGDETLTFPIVFGAEMLKMQLVGNVLVGDRPRPGIHQG